MHSSSETCLWQIKRPHGYSNLYMSKGGHLYIQDLRHNGEKLVYRCLEVQGGCCGVLHRDAVAGIGDPMVFQYGLHNHVAPKLHVEMNIKAKSGKSLDIVYEEVNNTMLPLGVLSMINDA